MGSGVVRVLPRNRIHVGTAVGRVAAADPSCEILGRQFERREGRVLTDFVGNDLIHRDAGLDVFCDGSEGNRAAEPCRHADGVSVERIAQLGNNCDVVPVGLE